MTTKHPKIYSSDPEALKRADPKTLNEAQRNYRAMLLRNDVERLKRYADNPAYLAEMAELLAPKQETQTETAEASAPATNNKDDVFA